MNELINGVYSLSEERAITKSLQVTKYQRKIMKGLQMIKFLCFKDSVSLFPLKSLNEIVAKVSNPLLLMR